MSETLRETGFVRSIKDGYAVVDLAITDACEECSAKILCKPSADKDDSKIITVIDNLGVKPGDKVEIEIKGEELFKASFMLYGLPLIILVLGIVLGNYFFQNESMSELLSFFTGFGSMLIYYGLFYVLGVKKKDKKESFPIIVSIVS